MIAKNIHEMNGENNWDVFFLTPRLEEFHEMMKRVIGGFIGGFNHLN